jgi:hypothetical protein
VAGVEAALMELLSWGRQARAHRPRGGDVDNIIVASSRSNAARALLKELGDEFALKDLGELHYFLIIEVAQNRDGIVLTQEKYANNLL